MKNFWISCVLIFYLLFNCVSAGSLGGPSTTPPYYAFQPYNNVFYNGQIAQGVVRMDNGFTVVGTSATMDTCLTVSGPIDLRNVNTIVLSSDLKLDNGVTFSSGGRIYGYDRAVILGGDLTIPAGKIIHIGGRIAIDGHGNKLILGKSAELFVDAGSTLTLRNLVLQNTQNNPGNPPVLCSTGGTAAYCSNLCLDNVELALADNFYFNRGQMFIHNDVAVTGTSAFVYRSCQPSFITSGAHLCFDKNTTFSVAPATFTDCPYTVHNTYTASNFIHMADATSVIDFDGCSYLTTMTGLRLTTGTVLFNNRVKLNSKASLGINTVNPATSLGTGSTGAYPYSVSWSPDERFIAVVTQDGNSLQIFSFNGSVNPNAIGTVTGFETPLSVTWSPDGRFIAVADLNDNSLDIFSFNGGVLNSTPIGTSATASFPTSVAWSPDGRFIAVANSDNGTSGNLMQIFSFNGAGNPTSLGTSATGPYPYSVSWSPDGCFVAVVNKNSSGTNGLEIFIIIGGVPSSTPIGTATTGSGPWTVAWSPDGRFIAVVNLNDNSLDIFSFNGGVLNSTPIGTVTGFHDPYSVAWSPDGRFIVVANYEGHSMPIFSFNGSGNPNHIATITGIDYPQSVSWSPDGRYIAATNYGDDLVQVFGINYVSDPTLQALSQSIVFGNSALGSSYDLNIDFLSGSNVLLNGDVNFDNVN